MIVCAKPALKNLFKMTYRKVQIKHENEKFFNTSSTKFREGAGNGAFFGLIFVKIPGNSQAHK